MFIMDLRHIVQNTSFLIQRSLGVQPHWHEIALVPYMVQYTPSKCLGKKTLWVKLIDYYLLVKIY